VKSKKSILVRLLLCCTLFLFTIFSVSCADDSDTIRDRESTYAAQTFTAMAQPASPIGNYSGTAQITVYFGGPYGGEPCVNSGTVTLTIADNGDAVLTAVGPDILPPNCTMSGDQHEFRAYGKLNKKDNSIQFDRCEGDKTTESTAAYSGSSFSGTIVCLYSDQSKGSNIEFTANRK
jgi:hypothetical protein